MSTIVDLLKAKRNWFFVSLLWILAWIVPWGRSPTVQGNLYLAFLTDMTRLGIALGIFVIPGALLYILLCEDDDLTRIGVGIVPVGFALSVFLIGVVGLIGRLAGFSFGLIKIIFALIGLGELIFLFFFKPDFAIRREHFLGFFRNIFDNVPLWLALIWAVSVAFNGYQFFIDDTTYVAYLTNWQFSTHLGFSNIVHHTNIIEDERFWLALYPMGQALLSDLSGVAGILLFSNYLELFLVPLAVIALYWFACVLGFSHKEAGILALLQIILYALMIDAAWPVGFWFFQNMVEDKVSATFLLAPVFFFFVLKLLNCPTKNNIALVSIGGVALVLTHPVILFLACVVAAGLSLFAWQMKKTTWRETLQLAVIIVALMLPYVAMRLYEHPSQASIPFDAGSVSTTFQAERYVHVVNDIFYGLNLDVLKLMDIPPESSVYSAFQVFRFFPVFLALVAGVLAFIKLREGAVYWYVATCVLMVTFAVVPYTGWILGYFISARMISRVSWFSPLGVAGGLVILPVIQYLRSRWVFRRFVKLPVNRGNRVEITAKNALTVTAFAGIMLVLVAFPHAPVYFDTLDHDKQLAQVGAYIDQHTYDWTTVIALDYTDLQLLPSVSAHASLISFREEKDYNPHNYFLSVPEIHMRKNDSNTFRSLDPSIPVENRCAILDKYDIRFVLTEAGNMDLFLSLVNACEKKFVNVYETKDMILLEAK